jgi:MscS family membrane protein
MKQAIRITVATLVVFGSTPLCAQHNAEFDPHPLKTADTSSPQATLKSFIDTCHEWHRRFYGEGKSFRSEAERAALASRALRCLDLSEVPASVETSVGREVAVCLKEVLDRIELPPEGIWPDAEQMAKEDIARWTIPNLLVSPAELLGFSRVQRKAKPPDHGAI